jgi:hypothetical protein
LHFSSRFVQLPEPCQRSRKIEMCDGMVSVCVEAPGASTNPAYSAEGTAAGNLFESSVCRIAFAGAGESTGAFWLLGVTSLTIGKDALCGRF